MVVSLSAHPASPRAGLAVTVDQERRADRLWLRFIVEGDTDAIEWPRKAPPIRTDGLWQHTCFEVFIRTGDGYVEYNLSPSDAWATYAFSGYREGMSPADQVVDVHGLDGGERYVALEAVIDLPSDATGPIALSAVIEATNGSLSYWALAHPSDKPDFHHPDSFVLEIP
ncbi:DOMON-like domain-containing protein [Brevundimonas sp. A19_0]|uniref:DOMON-like domain-containing protein n=1 Tax=Brevundimonas sp. A19_0 TaxID=2821087 RepID=UPI001ADB8272|nr:DOMON-like domain-containing protein [Brevundimonas sp. A19_0]MBO9500549.1 DOMON-like domain-containing protein [Brevundimonas sp. A19_0]